MGNKPSTEAPYRDPGLLSTYEGFTGPITDNKSGTKVREEFFHNNNPSREIQAILRRTNGWLSPPPQPNDLNFLIASFDQKKMYI